MSAVPPETPAQPSGFGGWLLLLVIGQTLSPLRTIAELALARESYEALMATPNGTTAVYGELVLNGAFLVLQLVTTIAMYRKSWRFPRLFACQFAGLIILIVADTIFVSQVLNLPISQIMPPGEQARTIGSTVGALLWVWYVFASVRVKNTFVN